LLFAGIGDARNLYATLVMITESELKAPSKRTFQITVNDIKPHVIARNLVIWLLLDELTKNEDSSLEITNAVFFIFCTAIMPAGAYGWLQSTISKAIMALETGTGMPSWVKVPSSDHPLVLQVLESWKNKAPQLYSNSFFVTETLRAMRSEPFSMDGCGVPEECRGEVDCYWRTLALRPPRALMHKENLSSKSFSGFLIPRRAPQQLPRCKPISRLIGSQTSQCLMSNGRRLVSISETTDQMYGVSQTNSFLPHGYLVQSTLMESLTMFGTSLPSSCPR
jgi:hypothetical protein